MRAALCRVSVLIVAVASSASLVSAQLTIVYHETFPFQLDQDIRELRLEDQGWTGWENGKTRGGNNGDNGRTVFDTSSNVPLRADLPATANSVPNPDDRDDETVEGMMFASRRGISWGYWTEETTLSQAQFQEVSFDVRFNTPDELHIIARIEDQWYIGEDFDFAPDDGGADWETITLSTDGAWALGDFRPELPGDDGEYDPPDDNEPSAAIMTSLGFGSADGGVDALPDGMITGFGIFSPLIWSRVRV